MLIWTHHKPDVPIHAETFEARHTGRAARSHNVSAPPRLPRLPARPSQMQSEHAVVGVWLPRGV
eukprot:4326480-Alexandrium_andersonii.AAC.1